MRAGMEENERKYVIIEGIQNKMNRSK